MIRASARSCSCCCRSSSAASAARRSSRTTAGSARPSGRYSGWSYCAALASSRFARSACARRARLVGVSAGHAAVRRIDDERAAALAVDDGARDRRDRSRSCCSRRRCRPAPVEPSPPCGGAGAIRIARRAPAVRSRSVDAPSRCCRRLLRRVSTSGCARRPLERRDRRVGPVALQVGLAVRACAASSHGLALPAGACAATGVERTSRGRQRPSADERRARRAVDRIADPLTGWLLRAASCADWPYISSSTNSTHLNCPSRAFGVRRGDRAACCIFHGRVNVSGSSIVASYWM